MIRAALRSFELFADFRDWELDRLRKMMEDLRLPSGRAFIEQGATAGDAEARAFIVVAGNVRIVRYDAQGDVVFETQVGPGAFLGVVALVLDHARAATCEAATDCRVLAMNRATFDAMFDADSRLAVKFKQVVARQLARDLRRANEALAAKAATS